MGKKEKKESKGIWLLKALLAGYVVTGGSADDTGTFTV